MMDIKANLGYAVEVTFDTAETDYFVYNDREYPLGDNGTMTIGVHSDELYHTPAWENEMINGALDAFSGSDWSAVRDIDYGMNP